MSFIESRSHHLEYWRGAGLSLSEDANCLVRGCPHFCRPIPQVLSVQADNIRRPDCWAQRVAAALAEPAQAECANQIFLRFSNSGTTPMAMPPIPTTLVTQSKVGML